MRAVGEVDSVLPIDGFVITLGRHNFGCEIIWSSAQSPGDIRHLFRESKIRNLKMSVSVEKQIFWFEIAVDDVVGVEVIESERDLSSVELGHRIRKALVQSEDVPHSLRKEAYLRLAKQAEQLTTLDKVHDHV